MPKDTKTLGNNKARACESLGFVHKKRLCQRFDTTSFIFKSFLFYRNINLCQQLFGSGFARIVQIAFGTGFIA